jgi:pyridoxamine 5'-phosphate oxidase
MTDPQRDIAAMRREYGAQQLLESEAGFDPIALFSRWFAQAADVNPGPWFEPNIMTLATIDADGAPDARIVLMKDFSPAGLTFFTNYDSRKGAQLAADNRAAVVFHWVMLERQVRMRGRTERLDRAASEAYFQRRPRGSQLGALASAQSQPITSRDELEQLLGELEARHADHPVPTPPNWGGYRLLPEEVEFWQGRANRLHDRLQYIIQPNGSWQRRRLAP